MAGFYLVAYDIAHPKRLKKIHRTLRKRGLPVQYSVFLCKASHSQMVRILDELEPLIEPTQDDVRAYPVRWPNGFMTSGKDADLASKAFWTTAAPENKKNSTKAPRKKKAVPQTGNVITRWIKRHLTPG